MKDAETTELATKTELTQVQICQDPLAVLSSIGMQKELEKRIALGKEIPIPPESAELIIQEVRDQVGQLLHLEHILERMGVDDMDIPETSRVDFEDYRERIKSQLLELVERYGSALSHESRWQYEFYESPTYSPDITYNQPTYANFKAAWDKLKQLIRDKKRQSAFLAAFQKERKQDVPGYESIIAHMSNGSTSLAGRIRKVEADAEDMWGSEAVRIAHLKKEHQKFTTEIHEGKAILETPTVVGLMNSIHENIFGSRAYKVSGPALVGPPGWGKTSMLQEYFRSFGLEPLSADIDPGQSAFSLMARPTLGLEKGLEEIRYLVELVGEFSEQQIKRMYEMDKDKFLTVFDIPEEEFRGIDSDKADVASGAWINVRRKIRSQLEQKLIEDFVSTVENIFLNKGYSYNLILTGLKNNQPVILNEFPELQEWTFLHGLLTAVPCSDDEAAPRPSSTPKEGEEIKNPKGWFFNTITGDWMRVPEHFRICFTGNIGIEYGNTGVPPALMSRIGGGLIQIEGLPPEEITRCIVWPLLSSKDTGEFLLKPEEAYKIHFLVTNFFPKLQARLNNISEEFFTISNREIIAMCRCLHPFYNEKPCSLDEALMRTLVRPAHARRYTESLKFIVAMLKGTGFLGGYDEEIKRMDKDLASERTQTIIGELKNPFRAYKYESDKDNYEGRCVVCGVDHCPVHGADSREFTRYTERAAEIAKVGLDIRLLKNIWGHLKKLLDKGEIALFVESFLGNAESEKVLFSVSKEERVKIEEYLVELQKEIQSDPGEAPEILEIIAKAVKRLLLPKSRVNQPAAKKAVERYVAEINALVGEENPDSKKIQRKVSSFLRLREAMAQLKIPVKDDDVVSSLVEQVPNLDARNVAQLVEMYPNSKDINSAVKVYIDANKEDLKEELDELKKELFADQMQANLRRSKQKISQTVKHTPEFEMLYPKFTKFFELAESMLQLGIIGSDEVQEVTRYAEHQMNQAISSGFTPRSYPTYIRVIKRLSRIKKINIDELVTQMCKPRSVSLPPMRAY
jgi:ribosomal protein L29